MGDFCPQPCGAGMGPGRSPGWKADVVEGIAVARAGWGRYIAVVGMERGHCLLSTPLQPLSSPPPPSRAGLEGAQQPLFLRMKACPRTGCCISTKASSPTVTSQGPSASKPHFW